MKLTPEDAARLVRHITEDPPNPRAQAAYQRGKEILAAADSGTVSFPPGLSRQERREAVARELSRMSKP